MQLYFETYLVITLLFTIFTICIASLYLLKTKYTIILTALTIILGIIVPYFLILLQWAVGSLGPEMQRIRFNPGITKEELEELRRTFVTYPPITEVAFNYFIDNIGFIILSIAIGIFLGILIKFLLQRRNIDDTKHRT